MGLGQVEGVARFQAVLAACWRPLVSVGDMHMWWATCRIALSEGGLSVTPARIH